MPKVQVDRSQDLVVQCVLIGSPADPPPGWQYEWADDNGRILGTGTDTGFGITFTISSADLQKPTFVVVIQCTPGGPSATGMQITFSQGGTVLGTFNCPLPTATFDITD
jgi:hypothetical protein